MFSQEHSQLLWHRAHQTCLVVSENEKVVFLMKKKSLGLLGKPPKACVGWWGYKVGSQQFMEVPSEQSGPTSVLTPAGVCSLKGTSKTRMSGSRCLQKVSPQLLLHWAVFSRKPIPGKSTALSSALSLWWIFFLIFKCVKDCPENATVIQIWEMATCFLWDLSQYHCCPRVGGGHLHAQNLLSAFSLNEQFLLLSVEMGQSATAASSLFSTNLCCCPVSSREFFLFFF